MNFSDILKSAKRQSDDIKWISSDSSLPAQRLRESLDYCFLNIPPSSRSVLETEVINGDEEQIQASIRELVAHELLIRLKLSPQFKPKVAGLTPDLSFSTANQTFIADVFLTYSPAKTINDLGDVIEVFDGSEPGTSRAHKIEHVLTQKCNKYAATNLPFVLFVFMGDHNVDVADLEKALFGMTIAETTLERTFPNGISRDRIRVGGCLLPDEEGNISYRNLAAAIACDWFDTLNREDRGKRLHCYVIHNYSNLRLPLKAFDGFGQVTWDRNGPTGWKAHYINDATAVAKFNTDGTLQLRPYTGNQPW